MTVVKALFFDLDGTLVDTHEANYLAYKDAIAQVLGDVPVADMLAQYISEGRSSKDFLPLVLSSVTPQQIVEINTVKKETYKNHASKTVLNEYLITFIKQFASSLVIGLVTTAKRHNVETILDAHGLHEYFDFIISGSDVSAMKPDPEAYNLALQKAGVSVDEALVFEDSEKGIQAAELAGLRVLHIKDFVL